MAEEYSKKEEKLIELLGFSHLLECLSPVELYKLMAEDAFIENRTGKAIESLRRCLKAINKAKPYRMTDEFDDLIEFD
jgi:hypothetical protein